MEQFFGVDCGSIPSCRGIEWESFRIWGELASVLESDGRVQGTAGEAIVAVDVGGGGFGGKEVS